MIVVIKKFILKILMYSFFFGNIYCGYYIYLYISFYFLGL